MSLTNGVLFLDELPEFKDQW
ncbi:MAG: hypothetical protein R2821_00730 [Flavobacteriaceae bacterium]